MRAKRARYQQGTIRKVPRANGSAWEVRFSETTGGTRKRKTLDFPFNSEYQMKRQSGNAVVRDVELRIGPVLVLKLTVRYVVPVGSILCTETYPLSGAGPMCFKKATKPSFSLFQVSATWTRSW